MSRIFRVFYCAYTKSGVRYSQALPFRIPRQLCRLRLIHLVAAKSGAYELMVMAKGSADKTDLSHWTKALPNPMQLEDFIVEKVHTLEMRMPIILRCSSEAQPFAFP